MTTPADRERDAYFMPAALNEVTATPEQVARTRNAMNPRKGTRIVTVDVSHRCTCGGMVRLHREYEPTSNAPVITFVGVPCDSCARTYTIEAPNGKPAPIALVPEPERPELLPRVNTSRLIYQDQTRDWQVTTPSWPIKGADINPHVVTQGTDWHAVALRLAGALKELAEYGVLIAKHGDSTGGVMSGNRVSRLADDALRAEGME